MTKEELNYIKDAFSQIIDDIAGNPDWYEAARAVASDLGTLERKLEEKVSSLPSNLDEAAKKEIERFCFDIVNIDSVWANMPLTKKFGLQMFKAGAEWREAQMKIPNSTELLSGWNYAKSILKEKDLRGDEWRLAYHAFLFGFTRGLNTKKSNE